MQLSPSGGYVVVSDEQGSAIWSVQQGKWVFSSSEQVKGAAFDIEEQRALMLGKSVLVADLGTGETRRTLLSDLPTTNAAFSSDGRRIFTVEANRLRVYAIDSESGTLLLDVVCKGQAVAAEHIENALRELAMSWDTTLAAQRPAGPN